MKRLLLIMVLVLALFLVLTGATLALDSGSVEGGGEIARLLAPLVAVAVVIERLIEMGFDLYENSIRRVSKAATQAAKKAKDQADGHLDWLRARIQDYESIVKDATQNFGPGKSLKPLRDAEDALANFRDRLEDYLRSPQYTTFKRKVTLVAGVVLGVVFACVWRLGMLDMLNIRAFTEWTAARYVDFIVTGLIIGTGAAPVHSLIALLQKSKDAVGSARELWSKQSETKVGELLRKNAMIKGLRAANEKLRKAYREQLTAELVRVERSLGEKNAEITYTEGGQENDG